MDEPPPEVTSNQEQGQGEDSNLIGGVEGPPSDQRKGSTDGGQESIVGSRSGSMIHPPPPPTIRPPDEGITIKSENNQELMPDDEQLLGEGDPDEIVMVYWGTFCHDRETRSERDCDRIDFQNPVRLTEVRVIPLGATLTLPDGTTQLGATNPSSIGITFYYNDLTDPSRCVYSKLSTFDYNEKGRILINWEDDEFENFTDTLIVKGNYSSVTLAIYGREVEHVPVKEIAPLPVPEPLPSAVEVEDLPETGIQDQGKSTADDESVEIDTTHIKVEISENDTKPIPGEEFSYHESQQNIKSEPLDVLDQHSIKHEASEMLHSNPHNNEYNQEDTRLSLKSSPPNETPKPIIPIITTWSNPTTGDYSNDDSCPIPMEVDEDDDAVTSPVDSERLQEDESNKDIKSPSSDKVQTDSEVEASPLQDSGPPLALALVEDTEEISDGEISSGAEDILTAQDSSPRMLDRPSVVVNTGEEEQLKLNIDASLDLSQPQCLSPTPARANDQEVTHVIDENNRSCMSDVSSEEEMDYFDDTGPTYESEWDQIVGTKYNKIFDPFSESFKVEKLKGSSMESYGKKYEIDHRMFTEKLKNAVAKYPSTNWDPSLQVNWIESIEQLVQQLPLVLVDMDISNSETAGIVDTLIFWARMGISTELASMCKHIEFVVRHIKLGLRLVQAICQSGKTVASKLVLTEWESEQENSEEQSICTFQGNLLNLLSKKGETSPAIQNMILKTLDTTLNTRDGFYEFIKKQGSGNFSYMSKLVELVSPKGVNQTSFSKRASFALRSFLTKVTLMDSLNGFEQLISSARNLNVEPDCSKCEEILDDILELGNSIEVRVSYPHKILTTQAQSNLPFNNFFGTVSDPRLNFVRCLREMEFMETSCNLLGYKEVSIQIAAILSEILKLLATWEIGLIFLCDEEAKTRNLITWTIPYTDPDSCFFTAHCLEIIQRLDVIEEGFKQKPNAESEADIVDGLQVMHAMMTTSCGRDSLINTLTLGNRIQILLKCIKVVGPPTDLDFQMTILRAVVKGYALEMLALVVKSSDNVEYLKEHGQDIHDFAVSLKEELGGSSDKPTDLIQYLKPVLVQSYFQLEELEHLVDAFKAGVEQFLGPQTKETNWKTAPELITMLRMLCEHALSTNTTERAWVDHLKPCDEPYIVELKGKMAIVQMNSQDILATFFSILARFHREFEHPALRSYQLVGSTGDMVAGILYPMVRLIHVILSCVIQVRGTQFRDMTSVHILLQTYFLTTGFPSTSLFYEKSQKVQIYIIATLQAYTLPNMKVDEASDEELKKSIWTSMVSELIDFTLSSPNTFLAGLKIFSELLPLPLPLHSQAPMAEEEKSEIIRCKRLWSAYLHGVSQKIQELIGLLCETTHSELVQLLQRVSLQIADLSASSCLVVCRAIMSQIVLSIEAQLEPRLVSQVPDSSTSLASWIDSTCPRLVYCTARTTRLLGFLASLVSNCGIFKAGLLTACRSGNKIDEKFCDFIPMLCTLLSSSPKGDEIALSHNQGQEHIITILEAISDVGHNMLVPVIARVESTRPSIDPEIIMSNALPNKEIITLICGALMIYLNSSLNNGYENLDSTEEVFHTLYLISDTEYGFYHLRMSLEKHSDVLFNFVSKLINSEFGKTEVFESVLRPLTSVIHFIKSLTSPRIEDEDFIPPRKSVVSQKELRKWLAWPVISDEAGKGDQLNESSDKPLGKDKEKSLENSRPLLILRSQMEKYIDEGRGVAFNYAHVENALDMLKNVLDFLEKESESSTTFDEVVVPAPLSLLELYNLRPINVLADSGNSSPSNWTVTSFPPPFLAYTDFVETDLMPYNLEDLARSYKDLDITKELRILFGLSGADGESGVNGKEGPSIDPNPDQSGVQHPISPDRRLTFGLNLRGSPGRGGFGRGAMALSGRGGFDPFRSRPPNTSRPPSLHVDDFNRARGSPRGNPTRPFTSDRGRSYNNRSQSQSQAPSLMSTPPFYQSRNENMTGARGRSLGSRGRAFGNSDDRWFGSSGDSRGNNPGQMYGSRIDSRSNYDDKRLGGGSHSTNSGGGRTPGTSRNSDSVSSSSTQRGQYVRSTPYQYRDRDGSGTGSRTSSSNTNQNQGTSSSGSRWRDRQQQRSSFNR